MADLLVVAGDISFFSRNMAAVRDCNAQLSEWPCPTVFVPGNHDLWADDRDAGRKTLSNATTLINEGVIVAGLKIWGSPVMPLSTGAFSMPSRIDRARVFGSIPNDTDILVTHSPPLEILDKAPGSPPAGCPELLMAVLQKKPNLHVFGHVHAAHGTSRIDDTMFVNASLLGPDGDITHRPIVVKVNRYG